MAPYKRITVKQRKLIKGVVAGKSITQAALDAGYGKGVNANSAKSQGSHELRNPNVSKAFDEALERAGLTMDSIASEIKAGLNAKKYGSHDSYVQIALKTKGFLSPDADGGAKSDKISIAIAVLDERGRRGLDG